MELRFNYTVRLVSTCMYVLHTLLFMPIVLYASILAFSEATGLPLVTCIVVLGGLCVFYTTVVCSITPFLTMLYITIYDCVGRFLICHLDRHTSGRTDVWCRHIPTVQGN